MGVSMEICLRVDRMRVMSRKKDPMEDVESREQMLEPAGS